MINIVKAVSSDVNFIAEVCRDAEGLYSKIIPKSFNKQADRYRRNGLPQEYDIYIIRYGENNVGFLGMAELNTDTIYLVALYFLTKLQRRGLGTIVMDKLREDEFKGKHVILQVHKEAIWAYDFYIKNGFKVVSEDFNTIRNYVDGMRNFAISSTILMSNSFR